VYLNAAEQQTTDGFWEINYQNNAKIRCRQSGLFGNVVKNDYI
jgi:hypothetical protein